MSAIAEVIVKRDEMGLTMASEAGQSADRPIDHVAFGMIGGAIYRVRVWTDSEWARLPASQRPGSAQPLPGLGMVAIEPVTDLEELPAPYRPSGDPRGSAPGGPIRD